jgi:hypothetical protein
MESPSFDKWKSAVRIDSGDGRWNVKRLAAYSIFAAAFLAAPGIAAAQDSAIGETSDIRLFPPRSLTLKGVVLGSWMQQPPEQRKADATLPPDASSYWVSPSGEGLATARV